MKAVCSSQFQLAVTAFIVRLKINLGASEVVLREAFPIVRCPLLSLLTFSTMLLFNRFPVLSAQGFLTYGVLLGVPPSSGTLILRTRINDATHKRKHWFNEKDV